jgi:hypothetical protein
MNAISSYSPSISTNINASDSRQKPQSSDTKSHKPKPVLEAQDFYDMANKYNVKDISIDETISMSKELYEKDEISLKGHAILSFDARGFNEGNIFSTSENENGNYNLINEYKTRIELNKKISEVESMTNNKEVLDILLKLDALKSRQPLNIKV